MRDNAEESQKTNLSYNPEIGDLNDLLYHLSDGVFIVDVDGRIIYANPALAKIAGYQAPQDIIGKLVVEIVDADTNEELLKWYEKMMVFHELDDIVLSYRKPDGQQIIVEINPGQPLQNGSIRGVVRDITVIRENELKLARFEKFYRSVVDMLPSAVTVARIDGTILEFNERAVQLYGLRKTREDQITTIFQSIAPSEHHRVPQLFAQLQEDRILLNEELLLQKVDNTVFYGEVSVRLMPGMYDDSDIMLIISRDISERKNLENNLRNLAITDDLTGLLNRRGFQFASKKVLRQNRQHNIDSTFVFLDINKMKDINDQFGHASGDWAIKMAAEVLQDQFASTGVLARWGGDEFVVLTTLTEQHVLEDRIDRCNKRLSELTHNESTSFKISFSIGTATLKNSDDIDLQRLLEQADRRMYRRKRANDQNVSPRVSNE